MGRCHAASDPLSSSASLASFPPCSLSAAHTPPLPPRALIEFRDEGADIVIMARTDARAGLGLEEALERCREFRKIGADITFLEAPQSEEEMRRYCQEVDGPKLANMLEVMFVLTKAVGSGRIFFFGVLKRVHRVW